MQMFFHVSAHKGNVDILETNLTSLKFCLTLAGVTEERYVNLRTVLFIFWLQYLTKGNHFSGTLGDLMQSLT